MGLINVLAGVRDLSMSHNNIICYDICTVNTTPYCSFPDCASEIKLLNVEIFSQV